METHRAELLIKTPQLRVDPRVRLAPHEDLIPPLDPALRRRLAEVDLSGFVSAGKGVEVAPRGCCQCSGSCVVAFC